MYFDWRKFISYGFFLASLCLEVAVAQVSYEDAFPNISFNLPVEIQNAQDGTNRLFVVEQPGTIKVFPNNPAVTSGQVSTFLDISSKVAYIAGQEIGLLGLAFHPQFQTNRYIYVHYVDAPGNYRINISRFQVSSTDPNYVDPSTETVLASFIKNLPYSNHNGGKISFGPDGYLYISIGDGGDGGDPTGNGQNLNTVFGSMLRIDVDLNGDNPVETNPELPNGNYEIPSDNPRVGQSGLDELYAWGIRNTWKFSFDETGRIWSGDVGQGVYEEINLIERGGNYGWNKFEANSEPSYGNSTVLSTTPDIKPIFFYDHSGGDVSITGGYVYRGSLTSTEIRDKYVYGDYASGRVWALDYDPTNGTSSNQLLFQTNGQYISSFGEDENGELYFSDYVPAAKIYKFTETQTGPIVTPVDGVGNWEALGSGTNGIVETIVSDNEGTLYVGGSFSSAGGVNVSNLAVYSEEQGWQSFGSGTNGVIYSIAVGDGGQVFVGGEFTQINGVNANNVAYWNGSSWNAMGTGTNGPVAKIALDATGNVFAGGVFSTMDGIAANNIAMWNETAWVALSDISTGAVGTNNEIRSLGFDGNGNLYVGGNFDTAGGNSAPRIARWDGSNWSGLGVGTSGFVQSILVADNYVYAGGNFAIAGSETVNRIARWNLTNNTWESLDFGLSGNVNAMAHDGTYLYVGGTFETASEVQDTNEIMNNIARWSEANGWEALGPDREVGVDTRVNALEFINNDTELITGGNFSRVGNISASNIAKWGEVLCNDNIITPEYQINGTWSSGLNVVTVEEGDVVILSILPNSIGFTVTLPDTSVVNGDLNLGAVTPSDTGTYTFTTAGGCSETFQLTVNASPPEEDSDGDGVPDDMDICPNTPTGTPVDADGCSVSVDEDSDGDGVLDDIDICPDTPAGTPVDADGCSVSVDEDSDGDGVLDDIDICPDTPAGSPVDDDGCIVSEIPSDNFTISSTGATCVGATDGQLTIAAGLSLTYTATISGEGSFSTMEGFSDMLVISGMAAGTYQLCISIEEYPDEEQCSTIIILEPQPLNVESVVDYDGKAISLQMSGGQKYVVEHNGNRLETSASEITLKLDQGPNLVKVSTDLECQGQFEREILFQDSILVYPNPFEEHFYINSPYHSGLDELNVRIYNFSGKEVYSKSFSLRNSNTVLVGDADLSDGMYILVLEQGIQRHVFKLMNR